MRELYGSKTLIRGRRIKYCRLGAYCLESVNSTLTGTDQLGFESNMPYMEDSATF